MRRQGGVIKCFSNGFGGKINRSDMFNDNTGSSGATKGNSDNGADFKGCIGRVGKCTSVRTE